MGSTAIFGCETRSESHTPTQPIRQIHTNTTAQNQNIAIFNPYTLYLDSLHLVSIMAV